MIVAMNLIYLFLKSLDLKSELNLEGIDDPESFSKNRGSMKGMLIDLLERRVPAREPVNGIMTGREIRISEKGLELIDKMEETMGGAAAVVNHHESSGTCAPTEEGQESQKMTFYSSTSDAQVSKLTVLSNMFSLYLGRLAFFRLMVYAEAIVLTLRR